jgi:hypothetical protein
VPFWQESQDARPRYTQMATGMTGRFSNEAIDEFIAIYREEFGEEIDRTEATALAWSGFVFRRAILALTQF